jgi:hypothetical protein
MCLSRGQRTVSVAGKPPVQTRGERVKKSVQILAALVVGIALGGGIVAATKHPTDTLFQSEAKAIALAATNQAHAAGKVPSENDFQKMAAKMFPPLSSAAYGSNAFVTFRGHAKFAFVFGRNSPQTYVCMTNPLTLGDIPQITTC